MSVSITITPKTKSVLIDVSNLEGTHKRGLEKALYEIGDEVVRETKRLIINGPKTGRIYNTSTGRHQASAPGEPPATRTGKLARSGDYKVRNWQEMTVGQTAAHAGFLATGTRGRMAPRPSLIVAVNNKAQDSVNSILDSVKRETRG